MRADLPMNYARILMAAKHDGHTSRDDSTTETLKTIRSKYRFVRSKTIFRGEKIIWENLNREINKIKELNATAISSFLWLKDKFPKKKLHNSAPKQTHLFALKHRNKKTTSPKHGFWTAGELHIRKMFKKKYQDTQFLLPQSAHFIQKIGLRAPKKIRNCELY